MATNPTHLHSVPDEDASLLPHTGAPGPSGLQDYIGHLEQMQQDRLLKRARHTRRTEEILSNRSLLVVETFVLGQAGRGLITERLLTTIPRITRSFDLLLTELGPSLSEDQLQLLQIAKDDFIAAEYEDKAEALKILTQVLRTTLVAALSRPDDEFRRRSGWESFKAGVTNDRTMLKERGLQPLSWWEEVTDDLGFTRHTERRLRADERSRRQAFLTLLTGPEDSYGEEV
jgi:hypothetical protein